MSTQIFNVIPSQTHTEFEERKAIAFSVMYNFIPKRFERINIYGLSFNA